MAQLEKMFLVESIKMSKLRIILILIGLIHNLGHISWNEDSLERLITHLRPSRWLSVREDAHSPKRERERDGRALPGQNPEHPQQKYRA